MDRRSASAATIARPSALQRAVSGGSYGTPAHLRRAILGSGLSSVRSVSQPLDVVDLTAEPGERERSGFWEKQERMVTSPDVISLDDDEEIQPPAKRVKTDKGSGNSEKEEDDGMQDQDIADEVMPGLPMPGLGKLNRGQKPLSAGQRPQTDSVGFAARKAHGVNPPAVATRVPLPKKVLDFSPWTGTHPEDVLTEHAIKNGYSDTPKNPSNSDCNSAKASIWPSLSSKNHQGLNMLSWLYMAVYEKRQALGRCTAPSTFKPPPRVTVTDTKREAWLRDLANPDVPLRKQSRTIPHGIRGKLLMDQCLTKSIPLSRAVWLAKCVGANELRAFKRKGVSGSAAASGEAKWVREWTIQVEQFLASVIAMCGQEDWKPSMNYAVKLATAFFAEQLLDTDHYLNWIVTSLSEATLDRLPIWIVLAQLYWKPITSYGKRGKALAEAILQHLHHMKDSSPAANAMLKTRLQKLVAILATTNRGCLIVPRVWSKYKTLLSPQSSPDSSEASPATDIVRRNERLAAPFDQSNAMQSSPLLEMYRNLDLVALDVNVDQLSALCFKLVPDTTTLVAALLEWASTLFRTGDARIYLASRLIAHLRVNARDTDAAVLHYLSGTSNTTIRTAGNVHMVIADLIRLDAFSVGRYLQWLISSGLASPDEKDSCACGLLTALPLTGLPIHLMNTRAALLRRFGLVTDESILVQKTVASIDQAMQASAEGQLHSIDIPASLTTSGRLIVSKELVQSVAMRAKSGSLWLSVFSVARDAIEQIGDLFSLADLVAIGAANDSTGLLATVCDTVSYHAKSFAALGNLPSLVEALADQYMALRSQQPLDRTLILALSGLVQRTSNKVSFIKTLNSDLAICEQQTSLIACSPASDSVIGMQAVSLDADNDIDAVFASGNSMDEQLMHRVFERVVQRAHKQESSALQPTSRVCGWLSQLRLVDGGGAYERIVQMWLRNELARAAPETLPIDAIECLIVSGSVPVHAVAEATLEVASPLVATQILTLLLSDTVANESLTSSEVYKLLLLKERCKEEHPDALGLLFRAAAESTELNTNAHDLLQFIIRRSTAVQGSMRSLFDSGKLTDVSEAHAGQMIKNILQLDRHGLGAADRLSVESVIKMASPLAVRYCVEGIRWMRSNTSWTDAEDAELQAALTVSFNEASDVWPQLLEVAGEKVHLGMHEWAMQTVLGATDSQNLDTHQEDAQHLHRCLQLLVATNGAASKVDGTADVDLMVAKLKDLDAELSTTGHDDDATALCKRRLNIFLHLSITHVHDTPSESDISKTSRLNLLSALCTLLLHPALQIYPDTIEYIHDLASTLSSALANDDSMIPRLQSLGKTTPDSRLTFILPPTHSPNSPWLALAAQIPQQGSQQQRLLNRQPSQNLQQQQQQGPRTSTSTPGSNQPPQPQRSQAASAGAPPGARPAVDIKISPFALRPWEVFPDATPVMGENDGALSLGLFGARRVG